MTNDTTKGAVEAWFAELSRCPSGCHCHSVPYAADANECACDGICCTDDWEPWLERCRTIDQQIETLKARIKELEDELASSRSG